jgi:hypothetical protein
MPPCLDMWACQGVQHGHGSQLSHLFVQWTFRPLKCAQWHAPSSIFPQICSNTPSLLSRLTSWGVKPLSLLFKHFPLWPCHLSARECLIQLTVWKLTFYSELHFKLPLSSISFFLFFFFFLKLKNISEEISMHINFTTSGLIQYSLFAFQILI